MSEFFNTKTINLSTFYFEYDTIEKGKAWKMNNKTIIQASWQLLLFTGF